MTLLVAPPHTWTFTIPNYRPPKSNDLFRAKFRKRMHLERECKQFVAWYGRDIPKATGKRRVAMHVALAMRQRLPDSDESCLKAVLDALTAQGLLIDDKRRWCECVPTVFELTRKRQPETVLTLEDLDDGEGHGNRMV